VTGGVDALVEMRESGIIEAVSLGMNDPHYVKRMLLEKPNGTFDSVMSAGAWNLIDQDGLELMLLCQSRGVKIHNAGIFASGLLVGGDHYKYEKAPAEIIARREKWAALAEKHGVPLPAAAIAFALAPAVVEKAAVGVKVRKRGARERFVAGSGRERPEAAVGGREGAGAARGGRAHTGGRVREGRREASDRRANTSCYYTCETRAENATAL
jgi:hypothetical protein